MRLLHVSDLHLGRSLGDLSREVEQRAVVAEMVAAAHEHDVALTVISGDVFEAFTPPAWAEDLFFELLDGLAAGGRRAVAVIAGNHDSGLRVAAAEPLARRLGILLAGDVGEPLRGHDVGGDAVRVIPLAAQVARVEVPGAEAPIIVGLLPFLSEARVARGLAGDLARNGDDAARYAQRLVRELEARAAHRDPAAVNVLALHQFVTGSAPSDSERRLRLGALSDLDASAIPSGMDYVALGHLHRPQTVAGAGSPAVYAGSPIAYSFSEAGQDKRAVLVTAVPGRPAVLRDVPLRGGRPLEVWAVSSLEEATARAAAPRSGSPIVEVRANLGRALGATEGDALFALPGVTVLAVRDLFDPHPSELSGRAGDELPEVRVEELFGELWARKYSGAPDEETLEELRSALMALGRGDARRSDGLRLVRLRVRGLRSFTRETEIDLERLGDQGLFAISGPTGAGKSTILDGIFLALFGRCPRGEPSECVSAGALEMSVRLELEEGRGAGARAIAVERRFRWAKRRASAEGAATGEVRGAPKHLPLRIEERQGDAWEAVDLGGRKADEYLAEQIVRVSMSDFQQAVVLPQGEFDALLRARPAERRTLVASLFRTEHLGQPLIDVLKGREMAVRGEMNRHEEAEREVAVSDADAQAAATLRETTAALAATAAGALGEAEQRAGALRLARQRCAARDLAAAQLDAVERDRAARAPDRERVTRGRRAAGAQAAVEELEEAEAEGGTAAVRASEAEEETRAAEVRRRAAAAALSEASAARAAELPRVLEQVGRARLAVERGRGLPALDADQQARARELGAAAEAKREAEKALEGARGRLAAAEREERATATQLDGVRVGEDERSAAVAAAAVAELLAAEARLATVMAAERAAAEARVEALAAALVGGEEEAQAAEALAAGAHAERRRLEMDAQRAAGEVDMAERALADARRAAAAADLAASLARGVPCPVCGAREHPGGDHRFAATAIAMAERALTGSRRAAKVAEGDLAERTREAAARDEEARVASARVEAIAADLTAAREAAARQAAGDEVPRAVAEAQAGVERIGARASVALSGLTPEARDEVREAARREPAGAAEARMTALAKRARQAETLERALTTLRDRAERARTEATAKLDARDLAERDRVAGEGRAEAAASLAHTRRDEIAALLAGLEAGPATPGGEPVRAQRALFEAAPRSRSAAAWVTELEARAAGLTEREEDARASLEAVRADVDRLALEAREASARRRETAARCERARTQAEGALARAGFESLGALRAALLDPAALDALDADLRRLEEAHERLYAVLAERRRDVDGEVSEAEARAGELARDAARRAADTALERAAQAAARGEEIARRRARALELRALIAALEPRARRLAQIRQVVSSNQLSELAAERHLEAVTRGAATLLGTLSSDRYALVRTSEGAFAVADAAHGGLTRGPSTLSGGETFLVSLALALSLSERIQLAGRTRFDFFFLDEGFGSLDAVTLDTALGALEQLRGPNRVIGMISHVPAIEERMPRRLRVATERRGGAATVTHEP